MARYTAASCSKALLLYEISEVPGREPKTTWYVQERGKAMQCYNGDDRKARQKYNELKNG